MTSIPAQTRSTGVLLQTRAALRESQLARGLAAAQTRRAAAFTCSSDASLRAPRDSDTCRCLRTARTIDLLAA